MQEESLKRGGGSVAALAEARPQEGSHCHRARQGLREKETRGRRGAQEREGESREEEAACNRTDLLYKIK
jgi:hypothetical protein